MPGHGGRKAATKLTGVLVAVVLCAALLAVLFIGGRLWWVSFYGSEAPPPAQTGAGVQRPAASAEPSGPGTAGPVVSTPETSAPAQPSAATPDTSARQPAQSTATASIQLAWDRVDDKSVTGYRILYGTEPGIHPESLNVGNQTSATLTGLQRATRYYIVAVSVDAQGNQSRPSNEVEVLTAQ